MRTTTVANEYPRGHYDAFPVLRVGALNVLKGADLDLYLADLVKKGSLLVDGFLGIDWNHVCERLLAIPGLGNLVAVHMRRAMLAEAELNMKLRHFVGNDDPVFGRLFDGTLDEFFNPEALELLRRRIGCEKLLVLGPGAALVHPSMPVVYLDASKESLQTGPNDAANLGQVTASPADFYKRAYFVDWPALERHRDSIRARIALWIDTNHAPWRALTGADLRRTIHLAGCQPFRAKPWVLPGPWGGQFLKRHLGLNSIQPNIAWSYELIAPENGVLVGDGEDYVELPFPFMVAQEPQAYLGAEIACRFGSQFPIRFDYLDTMDGGNLSCQCHPSDEFIRREFGEIFTQDETYYIVECQEGARVFLGLREDQDPGSFWKRARSAEAHRTPFEISQYVNAWPSRKHDLFLIPNGTVHCSGRGNLVLEISATPYIYTFKIYDYLRHDLKGRFRPLHIDYAERNTRPERNTRWVQSHLIARPELANEGADWKEYTLADSPLLFYGVRRVEFASRVYQRTEGGVMVVNLVEGEQADLVSAQGALRIHYAETAVVPAAAGEFELINRGRIPAKLVKAFVKRNQ